MDEIRHYLGEVIARSRPELTESDQKALIERIIDFIEKHNPKDRQGAMRMVAGEEARPSSRHRRVQAETAAPKAAELGFVITCQPDGKITEVLRDGLGFGSRLSRGTDFSGIVSRFHVRRAGRFLRSIRHGHVSYDCALTVLGASGMVRLFCSGFAVDGEIVIIAVEEPLATFVPQELSRLAEKKAGILGPVLKELAAWKHRQKSAATAEADDLPSSVPGSPSHATGEHSGAVGRRRLMELAAHDLRNPISGIMAACQYLVEDASKILQPHQVLILSSIESSSRLALRLIQELAEIPTIQLGEPRLELRSTDVVALLHWEAAAVRPLANSMAVKLDVQVTQQIPSLRVDAARVGEALHGLLVNAIGPSMMPGRIELTASYRRGEITVLLNREYAAAAGRRPTAGGVFGSKGYPRKLSDVHAALLLARTKRIVDAHGGSMRVDTQGKHANAWTVMLPAAADQPTSKE